jgi:transposase-like protein
MPRSKFRTSASRAPRWTPEQASRTLEKHASSGLSVAEFATREGLDAKRLYRWRERLGAAGSVSAAAAPTFVEVKAARQARVEVVLRTGHVLFVPDSFDAGALTQLIEILERATEC